MEWIITEQMFDGFRDYLEMEEKSSATIKKYLCDIRKLADYAKGSAINKELMLSYKEKLLYKDNYKPRSINSFLIAANRFFSYMGWYGINVKAYKVQEETFRPEDRCLSREEYFRLVKGARKKGRKRLVMVLQAICATGIRVSELQFFTVSAVKKGVVEINCKGKIRTVLLSDSLRKELLYYIVKEGIKQGKVFCTSSRKAVNRSNIWKEMKAVCDVAGVKQEKVFPHNLRHLFAVSFYKIKKDIAKLADILGHSNIETTRIYIRTTGKEYKKQLDQMGLVYKTTGITT